MVYGVSDVTVDRIASLDAKVSSSPMISGVPTAPKVIAIRFPVSATTTAASGGKPSPTRSGPTTAAGVPKPAAPSMNDPIRKTSNTTWTRRSSLTAANPPLMASNAPVCFRVYNSRIAPKTIQRIWVAVMKPLMVAAAIQRGLIPQPTAPAATATSHATGIARVAGQKRPTINTAMATSGNTATRTPARPFIDAPRSMSAGRAVDDDSQGSAPRSDGRSGVRSSLRPIHKER